MTAINTSNSTWCNMPAPAYTGMTGARREIELIKMYTKAFFGSPFQVTKEYLKSFVIKPSFTQQPLHALTKIALASVLCLTIYGIYKAFHNKPKPPTQNTPPPPPPRQQQNRQEVAPPEQQQPRNPAQQRAVPQAPAPRAVLQQNLYQNDDAAVRAAIAASLRPQAQVGNNDDAAMEAAVTVSLESARVEARNALENSKLFPEELRIAFTTEIEDQGNVNVGMALRKMLVKGLPNELGEAYASHKAQGLPEHLKEKVFQQWCNPVTNHHTLKTMVNGLLPHFTSS